MDPTKLWDSLTETQRGQSKATKGGVFIQSTKKKVSAQNARVAHKRLSDALLRYGGRKQAVRKLAPQRSQRESTVDNEQPVEEEADAFRFIEQINRMESALTRDLLFKELSRLDPEKGNPGWPGSTTSVSETATTNPAPPPMSHVQQLGQGKNWLDHLPAPKPIVDSGKLPDSFKKPAPMLKSLATNGFNAQLHRVSLLRGDWKPAGKPRKKKIYGSGKKSKAPPTDNPPPTTSCSAVADESVSSQPLAAASTHASLAEQVVQDVGALPTVVSAPNFVAYDRHGKKLGVAAVVQDFTYSYEAQHAALRIQKLWRGVSDRMMVALPGGLKETWNATKIQRAYRMAKARREYKLYMEVRAMESELHEKHGSLLVRLARGAIARSYVRKYRAVKVGAVVKIQTVFRAFYQRERGKVRKIIYRKWKAIAIQRVWRGHWARQLCRALRFQQLAKIRLKDDPDAQWGIVQVGMRLNAYKHDFRKLRGMLSDNSPAAWHQVLRRPRVQAEGKEGTFLRNPSEGLRTRLYSHALYQLSNGKKDPLARMLFPNQFSMETYVRKFQLESSDSAEDDADDSLRSMYLMVAIYEQGKNGVVLEVFDPESHRECVPITISHEDMKAMCRDDPGMLKGGRRFVDFRNWIVKSLCLKKEDDETLRVCCPLLPAEIEARLQEEKRAAQRLAEEDARVKAEEEARLAQLQAEKEAQIKAEEVRKKKEEEKRLDNERKAQAAQAAAEEKKAAAAAEEEERRREEERLATERKEKEAQLAAEAEARKKADEEAAKGCGCIIA